MVRIGIGACAVADGKPGIDTVKTCVMACPRPGSAVGVAECSGDRDAQRRDDRWWERVADLAVGGGLVPAEGPQWASPGRPFCSVSSAATSAITFLIWRGQPSPMFARLCWTAWVSGFSGGRTSSQRVAVSRNRASASSIRPVV